MTALPKLLTLSLLPLFAAASLQAATTYTVQSGDTLSSIARRNGTTASKLMAANGISDPKFLKIGQKLKVSGSASTSKPKSKSRTTSKPSSGSSHTVKSGETLYSISRSRGVSVSKLTAMNPGLDPSKLRVGQSIRTTGAAAKPVAKPAAKPKAKPIAQVVAKKTPAPAPKLAQKEAPASKPAPTTKPSVAPELLPVSKPAPVVIAAAAAPAPTPKPAPVVAAIQPVEKIELKRPAPAPSTIDSVMVDKEISFGALASKHRTSPKQLNELNGWRLKATTVLAKGSEIYVPGL